MLASDGSIFCDCLGQRLLPRFHRQQASQLSSLAAQSAYLAHTLTITLFGWLLQLLGSRKNGLEQGRLAVSQTRARHKQASRPC